MTIMPLSDSEMAKFIKVASATVSDMVRAQISGPMDKPIVESGLATVAMAEAHTFGRMAELSQEPGRTVICMEKSTVSADFCCNTSFVVDTSL